MFKSNYQKGCFSIFYSIGSSPCHLWQIHTKNGYAKRVKDEDINSLVLEIMGTNVSTTYMTSPKELKGSLGIKLPFLVLLIKNMHKYFTFQIQILDDTGFMRRFRVSNFQSKTSVKTFSTAMPMGMSLGWNQIHFNLADFTRRAYGTNYLETIRLTIHANVRVRRIYFTDRLYTDDTLPDDFRLMPRPKEIKIRKNFAVPKARPPSPTKSGGAEARSTHERLEHGSAKSEETKKTEASASQGAAPAELDPNALRTEGGPAVEPAASATPVPEAASSAEAPAVTEAVPAADAGPAPEMGPATDIASTAEAAPPPELGPAPESEPAS